MNTSIGHPRQWVAGLLAAACWLTAMNAAATIDGITGPAFALTASTGYLSTPDGNSVFAWGYGVAGEAMQYPGPTLIVDQGDVVTIELDNTLPVPVSIVFPGQRGVAAAGGAPGLLTREAAPGESVQYSFLAARAGTYIYYSGTRPELQIEMGLVGAIVVRPPSPNHAYEHPMTAFDREYLFVLGEIDPVIHQLAEVGELDSIDATQRAPTLWTLNGRSSPDTMAPAYAPWLPSQPYDCMPRMHAGERVLFRVVGAGRDPHPLHTHGNNMTVIARDGRQLESAPGAGPDLGTSQYTLQALPGATYDALFEWSGAKLGWDIYGHAATDPVAPHEYAPDHGKPFPVLLPGLQDLAVGTYYSGSPFLGAFGSLPPGSGELNMNGGMFFMIHSHLEKELANDDIFPGGMMTMLLVEPPFAPID